MPDQYGPAAPTLGLLLKLASLFTFIVSTTSQMFTTVPSATFLTDKDPKYVVTIGKEKKPEGELPNDLGGEYVVMTDSKGQKYQCALPLQVTDVESEVGDGSGSKPSDGKSSSKPVATLLESLGTACFYRVEGWWTYEVCHKKFVRQFHSERDQLMSEYYLGYFDEEETKAHQAELGGDEWTEEHTETGATQRYHSQFYTGGTPCDLNDQKRTTEVRYACSNDITSNVVSSIKEPETCHYVVSFLTPVLCSHKAFKQEEQPISFIDCNPIGTPEPKVEPVDAKATEDVAESAEAEAGNDLTAQETELSDEDAIKATEAKETTEQKPSQEEPTMGGTVTNEVQTPEDVPGEEATPAADVAISEDVLEDIAAVEEVDAAATNEVLTPEGVPGETATPADDVANSQDVQEGTTAAEEEASVPEEEEVGIPRIRGGLTSPTAVEDEAPMHSVDASTREESEEEMPQEALAGEDIVPDDGRARDEL